MSDIVYLETSVLLRILFNQDGRTEYVNRLKRAKRIITSRLTRVEAERAILRSASHHKEAERHRADLERDLRRLCAIIDFIEMDASVCDLAGSIRPQSKLRSLDAIHLATYQLLRQKEGSIEMMTCDDRLRAEI